MYPLIQPLPHFNPYDVVKIKNNGELALINEVYSNVGQKEDYYQWQYSVSLFHKNSKSKCSWYRYDELEYVNNIFEIIAKNSVHPFSSTKHVFKLDNLKRSHEKTIT